MPACSGEGRKIKAAKRGPKCQLGFTFGCTKDQGGTQGIRGRTFKRNQYFSLIRIKEKKISVLSSTKMRKVDVHGQ